MGYRNFESPDAATNISPWGILIGGEELHNNHHAFPSSARLSSRWWEFDIGWMYIRLFSVLGLARVRRVAREPLLQAEKNAVDMETVKAVISHRMHVLANYAREVIMPVANAELCHSENTAGVSRVRRGGCWCAKRPRWMRRAGSVWSRF